ncbi:MAG: aminotransferase class I/II-fold pyridoxal phosphate-dependent enzyme, partial [candidate division KSB1 bacterium]
MPQRITNSPYMEWAKLHSGGKYNLAASGVRWYALKDLPVTLADLEINGPSTYGHPPLQKAIADHFGVVTDMIVAAAGTSMANHLAMAATFEPGDEVLIEHPTYELLLSTALYLGAKVKRFARRAEDGFRLDPLEVERVLTPHTRLIVLANLHNPSGAFVDNAALAQVGAMARSVGARVLVDEVYLEAMFEQRPPSAIHLGKEFMVTSSLTKAYGLNGLRCGWVLAAPELARQMWRLNDLFGVIPAHPAELLSVIAFQHLARVAASSKALLQNNLALLHRFLDKHAALPCRKPEFGTIAFPKLPHGNVATLCALLREKYETTIVPGKFFEMP